MFRDSTSRTDSSWAIGSPTSDRPRTRSAGTESLRSTRYLAGGGVPMELHGKKGFNTLKDSWHARDTPWCFHGMLNTTISWASGWRPSDPIVRALTKIGRRD
jgi:hypothetical protein